jgi:hypothetical protein
MTFGREADRIGPGVQHPAHEAARSSAARYDRRPMAPAVFSTGRFIAEDPKSFRTLPYRHFRHVRYSISQQTESKRATDRTRMKRGLRMGKAELRKTWGRNMKTGLTTKDTKTNGRKLEH